MKRWRLVIHYIDKPTRTLEFEDIYEVGLVQRRVKCWRMDAPERILGPALSKDEYEQGYRVQQQGRDWVVYEPLEV